MSIPTRGLGRGLDALFAHTPESRPANAESQDTPVRQSLPLDMLRPNPKQPRKHFTEDQINDLAASIRNQGVLQPILVRPVGPNSYEIVAGERRWRASRLAGLTEVPVIIKDLSDQEALVIALVENLQREDLNPLEEARGMHQLREEFALSQDDLAQKLGKSRSAIANSLRLLALPGTIQDDLLEGRLSAGHARALIPITDPVAQEELRARILRENMPVRMAEKLVAIWKETGALPEDAAASFAPRTVSRSKAPALADVQRRLCEWLPHKVTVSGTQSKGRISLHYSSEEELGGLLALLETKETVAKGS